MTCEAVKQIERQDLFSLAYGCIRRGHLTGREMSGTPRGVGAPVARRDEPGAERSDVASSASDVSFIEWPGGAERRLATQ